MTGWEKRINKTIIIFLKHGLRLRGKLLSYEAGFLTLYDFKSGKEHIISQESIDRCEVENGVDQYG